MIKDNPQLPRGISQPHSVACQDASIKFNLRSETHKFCFSNIGDNNFAA
jgi:hypothetical protein